MSKIFIYVQGGSVQGVRSNDPDTEIEIFDVDNLRADDDCPRTGEEVSKMCEERVKEYPYPIL